MDILEDIHLFKKNMLIKLIYNSSIKELSYMKNEIFKEAKKLPKEKSLVVLKYFKKKINDTDNDFDSIVDKINVILPTIEEEKNNKPVIIKSI